MVNIKTYSGSTYPTDCFIDLYSMALYLQRYQDEGIRSSSEKLMSVLEKSCSAGKVPDVSAHLIPLLGKKVTASSHDEAYVKDDSSLLNNGFEVCDFVKDGEYWVPTGKNKSFLDALFYRTF